jgi:hypothetical protein
MEILDAEEKLGGEFPEDVKCFLQISNGRSGDREDGYLNAVGNALHSLDEWRNHVLLNRVGNREHYCDETLYKEIHQLGDSSEIDWEKDDSMKLILIGSAPYDYDVRFFLSLTTGMVWKMTGSFPDVDLIGSFVSWLDQDFHGDAEHFSDEEDASNSEDDDGGDEDDHF